MNLHYQWFLRSKPVGARVIRILNHGDGYIMSEIATGNNWKKKKILTLRHAAGADKFTTIKEAKASDKKKPVKKIRKAPIKERAQNPKRATMKIHKMEQRREREIQKSEERVALRTRFLYWISHLLQTYFRISKKNIKIE